MLLFLVLLAVVPAQAGQPPIGGKTAEPSGTPKRVFPRVPVGAGLQLRYAGEVSADGKMTRMSQFAMFFRSRDASSSTPAAPSQSIAQRQKDMETERENAAKQHVPPGIELHRSEQSVEDVQPPEHAVQIAKGHSVLGGLRDSIVSFAYGANHILVSPESVTTDAQERIIIADPGAHAVHVLARKAKDSFQIAGGPGRRLQMPKSIAADADGNIFVADPERKLILEYDSEGEFVRTIGSYGDEALLKHPTGIAIDRTAARLYVADPPLHTIFVFDLKGFLVARIEPRLDTTADAEPEELRAPQSVFVHNGELVVLDSSRILILNLQGKPQKAFKVATAPDWRMIPAPGLFVDPADHIYVSDSRSQIIREYSHDGQLLDTFGTPGIRMGEFLALSGMWADSRDRAYVIDGDRIQIFQFERQK